MASNGSAIVFPVVLDFQRYMYSAVAALTLTLCAVSILFNTIILTSVQWCRKPFSPRLLFSISLAASDGFVSAVVGTGLLVNRVILTVSDMKHSTYCFQLILNGFRLGGELVSVAHLFVLAINHWMGIVRPLLYKSKVTRGTAMRVIILCWFCPISLMLVYFSKSNGEGFRSENCHNRHFHQMSQIDPQVQRNARGVLTTALILGTYFIGYVPTVTWYIVVCDDCVIGIDQVSPDTRIFVSVVTDLFLIFKLMVNPLVYGARLLEIQDALRKMKNDFWTWCFRTCVPSVRTLEDNTLELRTIHCTAPTTRNNETTL